MALPLQVPSTQEIVSEIQISPGPASGLKYPVAVPPSGIVPNGVSQDLLSTSFGAGGSPKGLPVMEGGAATGVE